MYYKNDNIIVGLLKHQIKKSKFPNAEWCGEFNEFYYSVKLDVSGFDEDLIVKAMEELLSNSKWIKVNRSLVYASDINSPHHNLCTEKILFNVLKTNLEEFQALTLKENDA